MMSDSRGSFVPFFSSDKKALFLPSDMPAFQLDYTQYYYPAGVKFTGRTPVESMKIRRFILFYFILFYLLRHLCNVHIQYSAEYIRDT